MLLGWHVDSNLSRRMFLHRGAVGSLDDRIAGYHCNHSRTPTVYHATESTENELSRFYTAVDAPALSHQRDSWGLPDMDLEEISMRSRMGSCFADALVSAIPALPRPSRTTNALESYFALTYDSAHVLPFVVDAIAVSPQRTTIGYLGANARMRGMLARFVGELSAAEQLELVAASLPSETEGLSRAADLFVVDLGLDTDDVSSDSLEPEEASGLPHVPKDLRVVIEAFERLIDRERLRLKRGEHPRRFVLVNSATAFVESLVLEGFDCSATTPHSRVRRATVKLRSSHEPRASRNLSWFDRLESPPVPLDVRVGETVEVGGLKDFHAFGDGWAFPDVASIWTRGERAEILLTCSQARPGPHRVVLSFGRVGARPGQALTVTLSIDGKPVSRRLFAGGTSIVAWRASLPPEVMDGRVFTVGLRFEGRVPWLDDRQLGLHLRSFGISRDDQRQRLRDGAATVRRRLARARRLLAPAKT